MVTLLERIATKNHLSGLDQIGDGCALEELMDSLKQILGYDFRISEIDYKWFASIDKHDRIEKLGQVFTPYKIAQLIADLCIKSSNDRILDPCFGKGIFLNAAFNALSKIGGDTDKIFGVELDPMLFMKGLSEYLEKSRIQKIPRNFFNGSIFDYKAESFDTIILNPPYVRQEDLDLGGPSFLDKDILVSKTSINGSKLPGRSNLYSYFIVFLTSLLKEGGRMGVITSNSWLDSHFGEHLQDFLLQNFALEYLIDFEKDSFQNADVEDCIFIVRKKNKDEKDLSHTKFIHIKKLEDLRSLEKIISASKELDNERIRMRTVGEKELRLDRKWRKFLYMPDNLLRTIRDQLVPLSAVATVNRGLTTGWNEFFELNEQKIERYNIDPKYIKPIVNSPKDIRSFSTADSKASKFLFVERPLEVSRSGTYTYIKEWKAKSVTPRSKEWYVTKRSKTGTIIFGYIIRKTKAFILNMDGLLVRDNFYYVSPRHCEPLLLFGILNSSLCRAMLEFAGRRYGKGLLKIQTYELENLVIPDPIWMSREIKDTIIKQAEKLAEKKITDQNITDIIKEIDGAICKYLGDNLIPKQLSNLEEELKKARLDRAEAKSID